MGYLTVSKLTNIIDLPVQLPATEIKMGDWIVVGSVKITAPMRLRYRFTNLQMHLASVDIADIAAANKVLGNLGYAYMAVRKDYSTGSPGGAGALEVLSISDIGISERNPTESIYTAPGRYSWILVNNMQSASTSAVPSSTEINFRLSLTGMVRLELDNA